MKIHKTNKVLFYVLMNNIEFSDCLILLQEIFGSSRIAFEWLNYPHPKLKQKKPWEAILYGQSSSVIKILKEMQLSQKS